MDLEEMLKQCALLMPGAIGKPASAGGVRAQALLAIAATAESRLGLRKGYLADLSAEDDWSFVIKLHALIEAALTTLLRDVLNRPELEKWLSRLPMHDSAIGKVEMAKKLGALMPQQKAFLSAMAELRNDLVHDVRRTDVNLAAHVAALDANQRRAADKAFSLGIDGAPNGFFLDDPRRGIYWSTLWLLMQFALRHAMIADIASVRKHQRGDDPAEKVGAELPTSPAPCTRPPRDERGEP